VDAAEKDAGARDSDAWDGRAIRRLEKELDAKRQDGVEQLKRTAYFFDRHTGCSPDFLTEVRPVPGSAGS